MNMMILVLAATGVVSFKDASKIKSWDAWNDHEAKIAVTNALQNEKPCTTWRRLNALDVGLKEVGHLATRTSDQIRGSKWSVGCETMDRDYADWNSYKFLLPLLGVKHARFFSGWAKTEQQKGVLDFAWLDPQIRECASMKIKPWVCISYGNPVWGSDFRLGMRVKQVTDDPVAFDAWIRYTKALVARYADVVDEWEIWNEPFGQGEDYAKMFLRTARAIREVQPRAKIFCTAMRLSDYRCVLETLKQNDALDLGSYFIYHPYHQNPDDSYRNLAEGWHVAAEDLRKLVKGYSGAFDIMQGEVGCPAQLEFAHALAGVEWTEYAQAKWNLRRAIGDAVRAIPSSCFTMIDLQYTFMLQSFGLVRSNALKEFVYRRPSWYAMRNVYTLFDDDTLPIRIETSPADITRRADSREATSRTLSHATFSRFGQPLHFFWYSDARPSNRLEFDRVTVRVPDNLLQPWLGAGAVWVDMITGRICEIDPKDMTADPVTGETTVRNVPMWDSPILLARRYTVPFVLDWARATPFEIVDSLYRMGQHAMDMKAFPGSHTNETWLKMSNGEFLPCFDKYGQFRHREWPGKTHSDDDLKAAATEEAKDLASHSGPTDRDRFGGWKGGPRFEATGRFYVKKVNGKWWFVDPEGCLYWSFGPVRVTPSSAMTPMNGDTTTPRTGFDRPARDCFFTDLPPAEGSPFSKFWTTHDDLLWPFFQARNETRVYDLSSANLYRKYGEGYYETFADLAHRRLRSWGCNTIANSSDIKICLMDRTPYAERIESLSRPIAASWGGWFKFCDPWDVSFKRAITSALEAHGREAHDPWCLGFFIGNEIQWGAVETDLAQWTLQSPADQPAKIACVAHFRAKYHDIAALNAAWGSDYANWEDLLHSVAVPGEKAANDLAGFTRVIVEEYFKRTREAVKAFDPKLLYLGCRFACTCREWVIDACAKYCDVVSYNIYSKTLDGWKLPRGIDAPVLCGEFHFGATDRGPFGTGVCVARDQEDRAAKMKGYVRSALRNPFLVGVHWHQFSDQATSGRFDGEGLQVGWTDICDTPYPIMRAALREVGYGMYPTREAATAEVVAPNGFTMLNIIPSGADEKVSAEDAIEFAERTGHPHCLYSLTLYPQGYPAMKTVDAAIARYRRWAKRLEGTAVRPGILLQAIIGHWTQDLAEKDTEKWQRQINIKGVVTRYCPLDAGYQAYIREVGRKLAECHPSVILGDDDIRAFSPEAECFCPLHTAEYNRRAGTSLTPEAYRQLIAGARVDSPEHCLFTTLQRDTVAKVCALIREGIDAVDPSIPAGVCQPGWNWSMKQVPDYARAMAGPRHTPFLRLGNGNYFESSPKLDIGGVTLRTLSEAERLKDCGALLLDEADTWPQNLWSKSASAFHAKLVVAAFAGLKGAKIWCVNAHKGRFPVTRHYTDILADHRGYYEALSAASLGGTTQGVLIPCHPEFPTQSALKSARQADNAYDGGMAQKAFSWYGIPFAPTFDFNRDGIYSLSGEAAIERFTDDQIKAMLSKKALVDSGAAVALLKRGFGDLLGVSLREDKPLFTGDYDEITGVHMNYPKRCNPPLFRAAEGVRTLSSMIWRESSYVQAFERVAPSTVLYRNRLGGTVVTTAYNPDMHTAYACTEMRQQFFYEMLDALEGRTFDNICANTQNILTLVRRAKDGSDLVLVQNLNFDGENSVLLRRGEKPSSIEVLGDYGDWRKVDFAWQNGLVTVRIDLPFYETRVFRIRK